MDPDKIYLGQLTTQEVPVMEVHVSTYLSNALFPVLKARHCCCRYCFIIEKSITLELLPPLSCSSQGVRLLSEPSWTQSCPADVQALHEVKKGGNRCTRRREVQQLSNTNY